VFVCGVDSYFKLNGVKQGTLFHRLKLNVLRNVLLLIVSSLPSTYFSKHMPYKTPNQKPLCNIVANSVPPQTTDRRYPVTRSHPYWDWTDKRVQRVHKCGNNKRGNAIPTRQIIKVTNHALTILAGNGIVLPKLPDHRIDRRQKGFKMWTHIVAAFTVTINDYRGRIKLYPDKYRLQMNLASIKKICHRLRFSGCVGNCPTQRRLYTLHFSWCVTPWWN
jgi:hypothetical protein